MAKLLDLKKHYGPGVKLMCELCDSEYSANPADYLRTADEHGVQVL